jgi:aminopeptidase N
MYYKGANMLHTLRQVVNDDEKWRQLLRGLNREFYHQTVTTGQIENFMSKQVGRDLTPFFNQYLRDTRVPRLEYQFSPQKMRYRWSNCVPGFAMPVKIFLNGKERWLEPTTAWKELPGVPAKARVVPDPNFYITVASYPANNR